ncbi:MAG TPA: DNA mismatch repair endonuclease MutL [Ignavibacteria bacterium]|nr:DNA mismatch repair endonuclease MutL [Ignavibacteria bacterium]
MENKIVLLSQALSNKIAAGEVVSRPESVVKELMENSIDASSTQITLIIKDAGSSLIQVTDNGTGMNEEDALLSFQRHSTSKISSFEDLENIQTLGFRGEALASISSISQIELKTRTDGSDVGTLIKTEGSEITEVSKTGCEKGTSIAVKNLFYNTPGRRNFLKSNQTEFRHIYETFIRLAVSNPEIEFTFVNNDDIIFELKKAELKDRLQDIFTNKFSESLIEVNNGNEIIKINGYISRPNFTKKSKQDQYFYLNGRFFSNKTLNFAVYSGYGDLIDKGDYPSFFLFIDIDPKKVDVNVHPSKMEVKFEDDGAVFGFLRNSIKLALKNAELIFEIGFNNQLDLKNTPESFYYKESKESDTKKFSNITSLPRTDFDYPKKGNATNINSIFEASRKIEEDITEPDYEELKKEEQKNIFEHNKKSDSESFNVWQYQYKYIMCQTETGLMIIDQHAAHERILYEKAFLWLNSQSSFSQQLLIPIKLKLTVIDFQITSSLKDELHNLGFNLNLLKDNTIEITGLPSDVKIGDENKIFQDLIDQYKEYEMKLNLEKRDNLAKSFACRSAIKSGDKLTYTEMVGLIDNLFASQMPYVCPHGRPTVIRITTDELDKRFSRT